MNTLLDAGRLNSPLARNPVAPRFSRNATSTSEDYFEVSLGSGADDQEQIVFLIVPYSGRKSHPLPPIIGTSLMVEGVLDQVGRIEDAITHGVVFSAAQLPSHVITASTIDDDSVDWEFSVRTPKTRASGSLLVRLRHQGRGRPTHFDDED